MRPESTSATVRPVLTEMSNEFFAERARAKFIGLRCAPLFRANKRIAQYLVFNRESFKKLATNQGRAPGGAYNRITGEFGKRTYTCEETGLEYRIDDVLREQYADMFDAEVAATSILVTQTLMDHEASVAASYSGAGLSNTNVITDWSTVGSAKPIADFEAAFNKIGDACGCIASDLSIIIPRADWQELQKVDEIKDLTKYVWTGAAGGMIPTSIPAAVVAQALDVKEILIAQGSYDNQEEGYTENMTQFWPDGVIYIALLAPAESSLIVPSQARTILWTDDSPEFPVIESYREENTRSDVIRARFHSDEVVTGDTDILAYKLTNT